MTKAEAYEFLHDYCVGEHKKACRMIQLSDGYTERAMTKLEKEERTERLNKLKTDRERWEACVELLDSEHQFHIDMLEGRE